MRRITIVMDDQLYIQLINFAAEKSKQKMQPLSISDSIRELVRSVLVPKSVQEDDKDKQRS
ncbi:MAG: hypothetical protein QXQ39_06710 [Conexivisphaerales archaeon]